MHVPDATHLSSRRLLCDCAGPAGGGCRLCSIYSLHPLAAGLPTVKSIDASVCYAVCSAAAQAAAPSDRAIHRGASKTEGADGQEASHLRIP